MINAWREDIRRTGELRIAGKAGFRRAPWKGMLSRAIAEFRKLSKKYQLGVIFIADNQVDTAQVTVDTKPGIALVGNAPFQSLVPAGRPSSEGRIFRCDITLPADPKISAPQGQRRVGGDVLLVMLVHEMVHACGLSNEEHSKSGDLFMPSPTVLVGDTATEDKVDSGRTDSRKNRTAMPPLLPNDDTAAKIQDAWRRRPSAAPAPAAPIGASRASSAQRGPAGLIAGSITLAGSRRQGPLGLHAVDGVAAPAWT